MNMTEQRLSGPEEEILRAQIIAGSCILFIGPDISRKLFNRSGLTRQLAVCHGWGSTDASSFPWLAQCYELEHGRAALLSFIRKKIRKEPPACYRTIAALPFRLILTTNYDTLLEEAFDEQGVVYQKIIGDYDLKHGMLDRVRIVKLYGCITEPDSMVITEEDQFAFLDRWPNIIDVLGRGFSNKTLLFIGCDLAQRDLRHVYHYLGPHFSKTAPSAYLAQRGVPDSLAQYWATRGLTVLEAEAAELLQRVVNGIKVKEAKETVAEPIEGDAESLALEVAQFTEIGRTHQVNQDCIEICMPSDQRKNQWGNLFLVADGMGGYNGGEVASRLAADIIVEEYYADTKGDVPAGLSHAIEAANSAICQQARENPAQSNMGTTVVAAVVRGQELHVANVGDSRAYMIRGEEIDQITLDHSWVAEQVQAGRMTWEKTRNHPQRNLLTRALGLDTQVEIDIFQRRLEPKDIVVLCSDGLTEYVRDNEMAEIVNKHSSVLAAKRLVELASDRGGSDDMSVIVIKVTEEPL